MQHIDGLESSRWQCKWTKGQPNNRLNGINNNQPLAHSSSDAVECRHKNLPRTTVPSRLTSNTQRTIEWQRIQHKIQDTIAPVSLLIGMGEKVEERNGGRPRYDPLLSFSSAMGVHGGTSLERVQLEPSSSGTHYH